jgi:DNA polymerase-4
VPEPVSDAALERLFAEDEGLPVPTGRLSCALSQRNVLPTLPSSSRTISLISGTPDLPEFPSGPSSRITTHHASVAMPDLGSELAALGSRKIVHVDMDAFYASVEQRDDPNLRGRPVVVAWQGKRSVVCAASYEARRFGVRSAMPAVTAERMCPEAVFVPPDFVRYKAVSQAVREIFQRHTELIEPLSLDEAYLDVTENKTGLPTATLVAKMIRQQIAQELNLTASAGVAPNKFLAKIASDWRKPNGQFVIQPHEVQAFLLPVPVGRIPGVGKVTEARMERAGIKVVGDIFTMDREKLELAFGSYAQRLYELARGIDHNPVVPNRIRKQISAEDTFPEDIPIFACEPHVRRLAEKVWKASKDNVREARTIVLKLKTKEFNSFTRSSTPNQPIVEYDTFVQLAIGLLQRVELPAEQLYRLVGIGLSNFRHDERESSVTREEALFPAEIGSEV